VTTYGEAVKALLRAGFTHRDIIDMTKTEGRDETKRLGELALAEEAELIQQEEDETNEKA